MKDVMIDLETLGNKPGCMILSIGAVYFDPATGKLGNELYIVVATKGQEALGLHKDEDTLKWWLSQSEEARAVLIEAEADDAEPLDAALAQLTAFLASPGLGAVKVWGNGSDFDNAILTVCYRAIKQNIPWKFWNNRCFRTLKALYPEVKMEKQLVAHNALNDAIMQAEHACKILSTTQAPQLLPQRRPI